LELARSPGFAEVAGRVADDAPRDRFDGARVEEREEVEADGADLGSGLRQSSAASALGRRFRGGRASAEPAARREARDLAKEIASDHARQHARDSAAYRFADCAWPICKIA
jgi:hypothetical protein